MKTVFRLTASIAVMALLIVPSVSFAQAADTVRVSAQPPGNLNQVIMSDTTSSGVVTPNTVFLLQQTGTVDTTYYLTATITTRGNVHIIGRVNPNTGKPPVIAPFINSDNSSPSHYFVNEGNYDTLTVDGVYLLGTRTDSSTVSGVCATANADSQVYIFNHDVFENFGAGGHPNITNGGHGFSIYVTNCEFRDNQDDVPQNPAMLWAAHGPYECDTAEYINNTFFILGGTILGNAGYTGYLDFQHNTVFMTDKAGAFTVQQLWNAVIKDNIFFSVNSAGLDTAHVNEVGVYNANFYGPPAVIELDTLGTLKSAPYNLTDADMKIVIENNDYFWPKTIVDNWAQLNANGAGTAYGEIVPPVWIASTDPAMLTDKTTWPGITIANNDSVDPGFNSTLVQLASQEMATFIDTCWNKGSGQGIRPFVYLSSDPMTWTNVPSDWKTSQGYPVPENLAYSNTTLQSAGANGFALGDLNWFPKQLALWEEGKVNAIQSNGQQVPAQFKLSQNYPNPFNPTTEIRYSIAKTGIVSLKVYNVLGQEVATLVSGHESAGEHFVNFNASKFASGVYFYTLRQSGNSITKKMLLLK